MRFKLIALICAVFLVHTTPAFAQSPRGEIGGMFGFGGEITPDTEQESDPVAMNPTFGGYFQYEYPIQEWFMVGGRAIFTAFQSEAESDAEIGRTLAISLDPLVKFRYVFGASDHALYLAIPIGPSLTIPTDDTNRTLGFGNIDVSPGFAYNWSLLAGFALSGGGSEPGFHIEAGYNEQHVAYNVSGSFTEPFSGTTVTVDDRATGKFWQVGLNVGISWGM